MFRINYDLSLAGMSMDSPLQHVSALFVFLELDFCRDAIRTTDTQDDKKEIIGGRLNITDAQVTT